MTRNQNDSDGFTLVELLIVIIVLGILSTVVIMSVRGITDRGEKASCDGDRRTLSVAVEAYFAELGGVTIGPTGTDADRYERTLTNQGLLKEPSVLYDIDTDGEIVITPASRCTTI